MKNEAITWNFDRKKEERKYKTETSSCQGQLVFSIVKSFGCLCVFVIVSCTRRWHRWKTCVRCILRSCAGSGSITHWLCTLSSLHFTRSCLSQTLISTQWLLSEHIRSDTEHVTICVKLHLSSEGGNYIFVILKQKWISKESRWESVFFVQMLFYNVKQNVSTHDKLFRCDSISDSLNLSAV